MPNQQDAEFKKFAAAAKQYQDALGLPAVPGVDKITQSINKLGKQHNVLITYEIRELPSHGAPLAKPKSCACACLCACGI